MALKGDHNEIYENLKSLTESFIQKNILLAAIDDINSESLRPKYRSL